MVTYNYKCSGCSNIFKIEATVQEKEENTSEKFACPECHSKDIKQKFSAGNFIKNIFQDNNKACGCCSGENTCDISCKPKK